MGTPESTEVHKPLIFHRQIYQFNLQKSIYVHRNPRHLWVQMWVQIVYERLKMLTVKGIASKVKKTLNESSKTGKSRKVFVGDGGLFLYCKKGKRKDSVKWRMSYRIHGKQKDYSLGNYPEMSLKSARETSLEIKKRIKKGIDPNQLKKTEIVSRRTERTLFTNIANELLEHKKATVWRSDIVQKSEKQFLIRLNKHINPHLGALPISEIKRIHVTPLLRKIESQGSYETARRCFSIIREVFTYALNDGLIEVSPVVGLEKMLSASKNKKEYPFLLFSELSEFFKYLFEAKTAEINKLHMQLLVLNMTRPSEMRLAKWSELDLKSALWTVPESRTKGGKALLVPLAKQSVDLFLEIQSMKLDCDFVFPGRNLLKPCSENTLLQIMRRMGYPKEKLVAHSFRKTASTYLNEKGFNRDHIEAQLGHITGDVRSIYNKAQYLDGRREMLQSYANEVLSR